VWHEPSQEEDRRLLDLYRDGDASAFDELVQKYQKSVINLVYHYIGNAHNAEDVAQKIFIKVYFSLPKFDIRRPFFPWLYRITINQCYDELRHKKRKRTYTFSELSLEDTRSIDNLINRTDSGTAADEKQSEMQALLYEALEQLSDRHRKIIVLRDIEGVPYEEIAAILKCTEQAARLKVFRARNRLRTILEKTLTK
jgi:RNA polymerase sigma-70 factor (ECF subfamily)